MGFVIDASVWVAAGRGSLDLDALAPRLGDREVALAAVTASELLQLVHRAPSVALRGRREAFVERVLAAIPVLAFDAVVARAHARLAAQASDAGLTVGVHDLAVAATAIAHGRSVLTRDLRSFGRIPGLEVERC